MNTKILMIASAALMAVGGIALEFAPHDILNRFGAASDGVFPLFLQLIGALYLGFAMLNYMARGVLIGGIYSRPLATGNLAHFLIGALALIKYALSAQNPMPVWITAIIYSILAILFGITMLTHPLKEKAADK
jgi:hypothetical protein